MSDRSDDPLPRLSESDLRSRTGLLGHRVVWGLGLLLMIATIWSVLHFGANITDTCAAALPLLLIALSTWPGPYPAVHLRIIHGVGLVLWLAVAFWGIDGLELGGTTVLQLSAVYLLVSAMGVLLTIGAARASHTVSGVPPRSRRNTWISWLFGLFLWQLLSLVMTGGFDHPMGGKGGGLPLILLGYALARLALWLWDKKRNPNPE